MLNLDVWTAVAWMVVGGAIPAPALAAGQSALSTDRVWNFLDAVPAAVQRQRPWVRPDAFRAVQLAPELLLARLAGAPREFTPEARTAPLELLLPMPDGTFQRFAVAESPVMAPHLAGRFPEIRTYIGQGLDDPSATLRCDWTPAGFHAQVLRPGGAVYIDPYSQGDGTTYASYYRRDHVSAAQPFTCLTEAGNVPLPPGGSSLFFSSGETLQTYRLACAATGEYTQFHGGSVPSGLAAIVTAVNRVNGVYEVEVAVRMELVANNNLIVYTNDLTDPYTNADGIAMLGQNQATLDAVIGNSNYDIGHVFSTGGGGVAGLGVICRTGNKARGVTGLSSPIGDPFYIDYVCHEMGHQFGANHSFNGVGGSCGGNRNGGTAYEPGSGATIMGYTGICGPFDNLQPFSDPMFVWVSYDEIRSYITGGFGGSCDVPTATGNTAPFVEAGPNYVIPKATPFMLTAAGGDPDGDPIVYAWEERDLGPAQPAAGAGSEDNGTSPLFRTFDPVTEPSRVFPKLADLLDGTPTIGEQLPTTDRLLKFRVTVRDNRAGGGGVGFDTMQLTVTATSGPFEVTSPNTGVVWGGTKTVTWNVAGTATAPVNAPLVDLLLSTDGGLTFPTVLAAATANDGSESVTFPAVVTSAARVKVAAVDNVFFDVSDTNFTLDPAGAFEPPQPAIYPHDQLKNRYISFNPNNAASPVALRVELTAGPAPLGVIGYVDAPVEIGCPANCSGEYLSRTVPDPVVRNWPEAAVYVGDCRIVPAATYAVRATVDGSLYSDPLALPTIPRPTPKFWGDTVGEFYFVLWTPPNGVVNFADITSVLKTFQHDEVAPHPTWVDLHDETPNYVINFTDVLLAIKAFQGEVYPFADPAECP
ncbi:MAG: hypothetical protein HY763_13695 [Planctomycetes bacterium]|nr:hypothetical protein [Planctomycetota bacterium]